MRIDRWVRLFRSSPDAFLLRHEPYRGGDRQSATGFSLTELMIVVALFAILSAVAIPTYKDHIVRSRRSDAMAELLELYNRQEQFFAARMRYATAAELGAPFNSRYYRIQLQLESSTAYSLVATPLAGTSQSGDGRLRINASGLPQWDKHNNGSFTHLWRDH